MSHWPAPVGNLRMKAAWVCRPDQDVRRTAALICERAWVGRGVRVFRWPCGTVVIVPVASKADRELLHAHAAHHLATYCIDALQRGPRTVDVIHDLNWARFA